MSERLGILDVVIQANTQGLNLAEKDIRSLAGRLDGLINTAAKLALTFVSVRSAMKVSAKFDKEIAIQMESVARLESAIRSTGGAAGVSIKDFDKMAGSLQDLTTHSRAVIQEIQAVGLNFTNIKGKESMERYTLTVLNMADALQKSTNQMALTVGKALQDPERGMLSLQRIGLRLPADLAKTAVALYKIGDVAGAQEIIFQHLETRFAYTSQMLASTLPGAVKQTKNAFDNLFRVGMVEGVDKLRSSFIFLRDALQAPDVVADMQALGSSIQEFKASLVDLARYLIESREAVINFVKTIVSMYVLYKAANAVLAIKLAVEGLSVALGLSTLAIGGWAAALVAALGAWIYFQKEIKEANDTAGKFWEPSKDFMGVAGKLGLTSILEREEQRKRIQATKMEQLAKIKEQNALPVVGSPEEIAKSVQESNRYGLEVKGRMVNLLDNVRLLGDSAKDALKQVNEELKLIGPRSVDAEGKMLPAVNSLLEAKKSLEGIIKSSNKSGASQTKKDISLLVKQINLQKEFLGTSAENILPGLKSQLALFPVMSENWITLKRLILEQEDEIKDKQIENARIVRDFREKQEEELSDYLKTKATWNDGATSRMKFDYDRGLVGKAEMIAQVKKEYELAEIALANWTELEGDFTNEQKTERWKERIKLQAELNSRYTEMSSIIMEQINPVLSQLTEQYNANNISMEQVQQAVDQLITEYPELASALQFYIEKMEEAKKRTEETIETMISMAQGNLITAIKQMPVTFADAVANMAVSGGSLTEVFADIGKQIMMLILKTLILKALMAAFGGGGGGIGGATPNLTTVRPMSQGGVFSTAGMHAFAKGGVVNSPTMFPFAKGVGLMGEAGAEAIMPLKRGANGKLGVESSEGTGTTPPVIINVLDKGDLEQVTYEAMMKYPGSQIVTNHMMRKQAERGSLAFGGVTR